MCRGGFNLNATHHEIEDEDDNECESPNAERQTPNAKRYPPTANRSGVS
jgi:hypothetical protein